ncbi:hypothetical protein [Bacillus sp. JJ722]
MLFAKDYAIDLTANDQSIDPVPLEKQQGKKIIIQSIYLLVASKKTIKTG